MLNIESRVEDVVQRQSAEGWLEERAAGDSARTLKVWQMIGSLTGRVIQSNKCGFIQLRSSHRSQTHTTQTTALNWPIFEFE